MGGRAEVRESIQGCGQGPSRSVDRMRRRVCTVTSRNAMSIFGLAQSYKPPPVENAGFCETRVFGPIL